MPRPIAATFVALAVVWAVGVAVTVALPQNPIAGLALFAVVEVGVLCLLLIRAVRGGREGLVWWLMAAAVASLVSARGVALLQDPGLDPLRMVLNTAFVVLFVAGAATLTGRRTSRRSLALVLDALITTLGLAALSSLLVLRPFPGIRGDDLMVLAEVGGPLLALGALVGALTALGRAPTSAFWLVGGGITLIAVATVLSALLDAGATPLPAGAPPAGAPAEGAPPPTSSLFPEEIGWMVNALWPIAVLLIARGVWASKPAPTKTPRSAIVAWLPYIFLFAALGVVVAAALVPVPTVAVLCATLALLLGAARFLVTVRTLDRLRRETVEMNAKLEIANRETKAAADAKAAFLATMSHEIRTPMNAVVGMTGLLLDTPLDRTQRDYVETVRRSGDMLLDLINDILDFSKIESDGLVLERRPFSLHATVEHAVELLAFAADGKGVELLCDIGADVPDGVVGDQTRTGQILVNLIANAVKFTEEGSVTVSARAVGDGAVAIAVRDTGIGIPEDRRDRLFRSFSQVNSSTTRLYGGTGLGLSISKALSDAMGGDITVDSEVGVGSEFTLMLPVERAESPVTSAAGDDEVLVGRRALVVDDNPANLEITGAQLDRLGVASETAADAVELLTRIARMGVPDVVVLDMVLPDMDGVELGRRLRRVAGWEHVPFVLLSSLGASLEPEERDMFAGVLNKPVIRPTLRRALLEALGSRETAPAPAVGATAQGMRVLLAEDNEINQKTSSLVLQKLGHEVVVVGDGADALAAARQERWDVILMDVHMPELDGIEATRRVRDLEGPHGDVPIIALTASVADDVLRDAREAGADGVLGKPFRTEELVGTLDGVARRPRTTPVTPRREVSAAATDPRPEEERVESDSATVIDPEYREMLLEFEPARLVGLIEKFEGQCDQAREGLAGRMDTDEFAGLLHKLVGSSGSLGLMDLARLVVTFETAVREGSDLPVDSTSRFEAETARATTALIELRG
ncbi:response regulator [Microbacterium aquimaris]|uniref:hybrid sensor histidine kinase/response regulator n=1 Tax=Microbacterium aquimaris TaxID=459816 RepID=UPI002AD45E13|nr:response regulator [Microbacterium aquimaris]MDZ8276594.1 response regulator [Microbacterium aquimaris]